MGAIDRRPDLFDTALDEIAELLGSGRREEARAMLSEFVEDAVDAALADAAISQDDGTRIPLDQVLKTHGLEG